MAHGLYQPKASRGRTLPSPFCTLLGVRPRLALVLRQSGVLNTGRGVRAVGRLVLQHSPSTRGHVEEAELPGVSRAREGLRKDVGRHVVRRAVE